MTDCEKAEQIVYISCVDEVRYSFVSHLSEAIRRKGINDVFEDSDDLLSEEAQEKVERARVSVMVLPGNRKPSTASACLGKLRKILECQRNDDQVVVPVLYGVRIVEGEWLNELKEITGLSPVHQSRKECTDSELVEEIARDVYDKLYHIGIYSKLLEIKKMVCNQPFGIRSVGIWGMPGIGKTTLAKAVFVQMSGEFDACCFIKDFDKVIHLKGLYRLLEEQFLEEKPSDGGTITKLSLLRDKLNNKKVLVVLDDLHNHLAAKSFLGGFDWFGPESLIIITSRDKQVFRLCQVDQIYEVHGLNEKEALQLFSLCASINDMAKQNLGELSMKVIKYANGNPLALNIYGSELKGKKKLEMETAFLELKRRPHFKIIDALKSSYDTLSDSEKNIFLDIACFFQGENVDYVMQLLEGCGFFPHDGIDVLVEKCMVTLSENRVRMHNLIQDFGREIKNGERRNRLWEPHSIKYLLEDNEHKANVEPKTTTERAQGIEEIEGMFLDTSNLSFDIKPAAFVNMLNLRLLKIYCSSPEIHPGINFPKGFLHSLPNELRLLHWENYPLQILPQNFDPMHLVEINMPYSQLQKLWDGTKNLEMLRTIRLCHSQKLVDIKDLLNAPNLEVIDLQGCTRLQSFPATDQLRHLRVVNLSGCTKIESFPKIPPNTETLHLQGTGITELPLSIVKPDYRELLNLLNDIPGLSGVSNLKQNDLERLTSLMKMSSSSQDLGKLICLDLKDCSRLRSLPNMVNLEFLKVLDLSGCSELETIQGFPRNLKELNIAGTAVREVPQLPQSLELLNAHGCISLKSIPFNSENLPMHYIFSNCFNLSPQVLNDFLVKVLSNIKPIPRELLQELNETPAFSFCAPSHANQDSTLDLQLGSSVMTRLDPSWRNTLVGFAMLVEVSFSEDYSDATGFGISCVCRWKNKEGHSHRIERNLHCRAAGKAAPKVQKDHMFVFCDAKMHLSTGEGNDPDILADLVVFEFFPVHKQTKRLDDTCTVTRCGVCVINAPTGKTSLEHISAGLSLDPVEFSGNGVKEVLRVSYDGLQEIYKALFLYIACLFNDEDFTLVAPLISSIDVDIISGLKALANRSLIRVSSNGEIAMHCLLRQMGKEILYKQSMLPGSSKDLTRDFEKVSMASSSSRNWKYDVYPSFSGQDVSKEFLSHCLVACKHKSINIFDDNIIDRGQPSIPLLVQVIRESRISIVVFSKKYASSSWLLNELVVMLKCRQELGQIVIPIFYDVDPTDIRKQTGEFGRHFKQTYKGKTEDEKQQWQRALMGIAGISGYNIANRDHEANMIEKIFIDVSNILGCTPSINFHGLVGMEAHGKMKSQGVYEVVADKIPVPKVGRKHIQTTVGLEVMVEKAWKSLMNADRRTLGLYGMGGVGKTTLLARINNKFVDEFDVVIWVVVSKDLQNEGIQNQILGRLGFDEKWKGETEKASSIYNILSRKKFVLLLDDLWSEVNLNKIGVPPPTRDNGSKIVFTTRSKEVCKDMKADDELKIEGLSPDEAWELFRNTVGEAPLKRHEDIPALARKVAEKCCGLPLALNVIGKAMACKEDVHEWRHAVDVLNSSSHEFPGMEEKIFSILKFSYDGLKDQNVKSCFLYCSLFPEDYEINKEELIEYWIGEGFINRNRDEDGSNNQGHAIIGLLVRAHLLVDVDVKFPAKVKMYDVVRKMALWIGSNFKKEEEKLCVKSGAQLRRISNDINWNVVKRISLMSNQIEEISCRPECPNLSTLLLRDNKLKVIPGEFFQFMKALVVLDLSQNRALCALPEEICSLSSLEYLNLSSTWIKSLPVGLKGLRKLISLDLESTFRLESIAGIGTSLPNLQVLKLFLSGVSIDAGLLEELQLLEHLQILTANVKDALILERIQGVERLANCIRGLYLENMSAEVVVLNTVALGGLQRLYIRKCNISEIKIDWESKEREELLCTSSQGFKHLSTVEIGYLKGSKDLTWLLFAQNLRSLVVWRSESIEEIINREKGMSISNVHPDMAVPFGKLESLTVDHEAIVIDVSNILGCTPSINFHGLVGMEAHLAKMKSLLCLESEEVKMVGIWGPSGIGKSTIARFLYDEISSKFEGNAFVDLLSDGYNQRGHMDGYGAKLYLQQLVLSQIFGYIKINHLGAMQERLKDQKVLIILDGVADLLLLEALAGESSWFGPGSRIIVITKDLRLLKAHGINYIYKVGLPFKKQALQMFCQSAFGQNSPPDGFMELATEVAESAGNLPLGLKVFGSYLRRMNKEQWLKALPQLRKDLDGKIESILKFGYDGLCDEDKDLFLYISCLFNHGTVEDLTRLLTSCFLDVEHRLTILAEKSIIDISEHGNVTMHHLQQQLGREIVRRECIQPGKRRFLVDCLDIWKVLAENTGTRSVVGISLDMSEIKELYISERGFNEMINLQFLKFYTHLGDKETKVRLPRGLDFLSHKLRLLHWEGFPMRCMPSNFNPKYLVELTLIASKLEELWSGIQPLQSLKCMNLRGSLDLREISDLTYTTNLETLDLGGCSSLTKLPSSIGHLHKLKDLDMERCIYLEVLPTGINLESLYYLNLNGCSRLTSFPEISRSISDLYLDGTAIEEVPWWIENISGLSYLSMNGCNKLSKISPNISKLKLLVEVDFSECRALTEDSWQNHHEEISTSLMKVNMSGNSFERLPDTWTSIQPEDLDLGNCRNLVSLPELPASLSILTANYCESLESLYGSFDHPQMALQFINCFKLNHQAREFILHSDCAYAILPGGELPAYFTHRVDGSFLTVSLPRISLSKKILSFKACMVVESRVCWFDFGVIWLFRGGKDNKYFSCSTNIYSKTNHLIIFGFEFSLDGVNYPPAGLNYSDVQFEFFCHDHTKEMIQIKECGIRLLEVSPSLDGSRKSSETEDDGKSRENDAEASRSRKKMRVTSRTTQEPPGGVSSLIPR